MAHDNEVVHPLKEFAERIALPPRQALAGLSVAQQSCDRSLKVLHVQPDCVVGLGPACACSRVGYRVRTLIRLFLLSKPSAAGTKSCTPQ